MDILSKLGIDLWATLVQAVNFFILLGILTYLLYRPILRALDRRRIRIATAEKHAEELEIKLKEAEEEARKIVHTAHAEARSVVDAARKTAKDQEEQIVLEAKNKAEKLIKEGRAQIASERDTALNQLTDMVGQLTIAATQKLLQREVTAKDHEHFVAEAIRELSIHA